MPQFFDVVGNYGDHRQGKIRVQVTQLMKCFRDLVFKT